MKAVTQQEMEKAMATMMLPGFKYNIQKDSSNRDIRRLEMKLDALRRKVQNCDCDAIYFDYEPVP